MLIFNIYRSIYQLMNNNLRRIFLLIYDNNVIATHTNLDKFYYLILDSDIGFKLSKSTLRNRFIDKNRFNHTDVNGRVYWLQKIENTK